MYPGYYNIYYIVFEKKRNITLIFLYIYYKMSKKMSSTAQHTQTIKCPTKCPSCQNSNFHTHRLLGESFSLALELHRLNLDSHCHRCLMTAQDVISSNNFTSTAGSIVSSQLDTHRQRGSPSYEQPCVTTAINDLASEQRGRRMSRTPRSIGSKERRSRSNSSTSGSDSRLNQSNNIVTCCALQTSLCQCENCQQSQLYTHRQRGSPSYEQPCVTTAINDLAQ